MPEGANHAAHEALVERAPVKPKLFGDRQAVASREESQRDRAHVSSPDLLPRLV